MSKKKIYIIRHGQTDYNKVNMVQGSGIDAVLNDEGKRQAQAFYNAYKVANFDKIYTSELQRTHQTVANFLKDGVEHEILSGLNEINWGIKEGEELSDDPKSYYAKVSKAWEEGKMDVKIEGGESPLDVLERQKPVVRHIMSRKDENEILICMHGRAMRIFISYLLDTPLKEMGQYNHSNLCLYLLEWDGSKFSLSEMNNTEHLD